VEGDQFGVVLVAAWVWPAEVWPAEAKPPVVQPAALWFPVCGVEGGTRRVL